MQIRRLASAVLAAWVPTLWVAAAAPAEAAVERPGREELRVCADPNSLPFSNEKGEGFENRLAGMIAADLGVPVSYVWWPQTIGFVRNTLGARRCDIVMGTASGEALMQNTNPYYRSVYALVYRTGSGLKAAGLSDPGLQGARIGVVAQTPAVDALHRNGLYNLEPYQLAIDTRVHQPARTAVEDVAVGHTDAAVIWGPLAAYWAKRQPVPLTVVPLTGDAAERLSFNISMGIRPEEPDWKHWLNDWIRTNQPRIDALLAEYDVPMLDRHGQPMAVRPPEPQGYRMQDYRAPVPATLSGAKVLGTDELAALLAAEHRPVLLDVNASAAPIPQGREAAGWMPRPHDTLPGAVWLPDVGVGAPSPEQARYFEQALKQASAGDAAAPLVFFCRRNCWMSWNAAKRARELGYGSVFWYPDGTDGWQESGRPLQPTEPWEGGPARG